MIIGNGDIAKVLHEYGYNESSLVFIAAGLSNSSRANITNLTREINLLNKYNGYHIVYFSSLCVNYEPETEYSKYKLFIENHIKKYFKYYTIVRIGNITWGDNPNTLVNYLKNNPKAERRDVKRYLLDKDQFIYSLDFIKLGTSDTINIIGKPINVKEYEFHTNK